MATGTGTGLSGLLGKAAADTSEGNAGSGGSTEPTQEEIDAKLAADAQAASDAATPIDPQMQDFSGNPSQESAVVKANELSAPGRDQLNQTDEMAVTQPIAPRRAVNPITVPEYTYRRDDIREFQMGEFQFKNHVLVVRGDTKHERFLSLLTDMPEYDQNHIVEYHPEVLQNLTRPSPVTRGIVGTSNIPDDKIQNRGSFGPKF